MKNTKQFLRLFLILPLCFVAGARADSFALHFNFQRSIQGTNPPVFSAFPNISCIPQPVTQHTVQSPNNQLIGHASTNSNGSQGANFSSLESLLNEITNGVWTINMNVGLPSQSNFFFRVNAVAINTNNFGQPLITFPVDGAVNVPTNTPFAWIGPTNFTTLGISGFQAAGPFNFFQNLGPATTSFPTNLPPGTNNFQIFYTKPLLTGVSITTPTNGPLSLPGWSFDSQLASQAKSQFTVAGSGGGGPHIIGRVLDDVNGPVSGIRIIAIGSFGVVTNTTDNTGTFNFPVSDGQASLKLDDNDAFTFAYVYPDLFITVTNGVDVTGVDYNVLTGYRLLQGNISDTNGIQIVGVTISAFASINGTNYNAPAVKSDAIGNYTLVVPDGTWTVFLDCGEVANLGFNCPNPQNANVSGANAFLAFVLTSGISGTDVKNYHVVKGQLFRQTGTTPASQNQFSASAEVNTSDLLANTVSNASVTLPNNNVISLDPDGSDSLNTETTATSLAALNSAAPNGVFKMNMQTIHDGDFSVPLSLTGDTYPNTPTILNFTTTQAVNPTNSLLVSWGAFTGGNANDFILFEIKDTNSVVSGDNTVFKTGNNPGEAGALNGTATSVTVPGNTFTAGKTYQARLLFAKLVTRDTTNYPGAFGFSAYYKETDFDITTVTAGSLVIATDRLPGRQAGLPYSAQLNGAGGSGAGYTWSIVGGALPVGLTLNTSSGVISGTPTTIGTSSVVIRLKDSVNHTFSTAYSINIFPMPNGIPIATTAQSEISFGAATDGTNVLVAIQGDANSASNITAQLIGPNGNLLGARINIGRTGRAPTTYFGGGVYLVVWQDNANSPNDDIYGARINTAGQLLGAPFVISSAAGEQKLDSFRGIAFNGTNFFVIWRDKRAVTTGGQHYIYGQFVSPNGTLVGNDIQISDGSGNSAAVFFNGSNFLVAWVEGSNDTDIGGQLLKANGSRQGGDNFLIDANSYPSDNPIDISFDGETYLVVFSDEVSSQNWDIIGRTVSPSGGGALDRFNIATGPVSQKLPHLTFLNGRYLVQWVEGLEGTLPTGTGRAQFFENKLPSGLPFMLPNESFAARVPVTFVFPVGQRLFGLTDWISLVPRADNSGDGSDIADGDVFGQFFSFGPPVISKQPPPQRSVTVGSQVLFGVMVTGSGPLSFQWQFNGSAIPGATNPNFLIPNAQPANAGVYSVVITNSLGSVTSADSALTVLTPPVISTQPVSQTVSIGATVTFTVAASGGGGVTYQWRYNGVNIAGATDSSLALTNVQPSDSGRYRVTVANPALAIDSVPAILVVTTTSFNFADNFADRAGTNSASGIVSGNNTNASKESGEPAHGGNVGGKSVWFTWTAPASGIVTFTTRGSSFDTLLAAYTGTDIGNLTLIASDNDGGGFLSSKITFNAISNTVYNIAVDGSYGANGAVVLGWILEQGVITPEILTQPQSQVVPQGTNVTLSVAANLNNGALTYQWSFNGSDIVDETNTSLSITNFQSTNSGVYRVTVTLTSNGRFVLSDLAIVQLGAAKAVAALDKFLDVTPLGGNVAASISQLSKDHGKDGGSAPAGGFTGTQIFNTFGATKEDGEPNHCDVPGGASYWYAYKAPATGLLTVDTTNSSFDTVLALYSGPAVINDFTNLTSLDCANFYSDTTGESVSVTVTNGSTYYIVVDGVGGASGAVTLSYSLGAAPSITTNPVPRTVTPGSSVTFSVAATGAETLTYQWRFNGSVISNATDSAYTFIASNANYAGSYSVIVSNTIGVATSSDATLVVGAETTLPKIAFTSPSDGARNSNGVVTVTGTASDNARVTQVFVRANNDATNQLASGTTNWTASVTLVPGTNTITAYAVDSSGNHSVTNSRRIVFFVLQPFTLSTNGLGSVTSVLNGQMLEVGKSITLTATPQAGQLFINWSLGSTSTSPSLTFTMQTNLALQANFLANPFIQRAGNYSGLFSIPNAVTHETSGFFTMTVSSSGAFSCKLLTAGLKPACSGTFTFEGFGNATAIRKGLSSLNLSLALDVTNNTGEVTGTVGDGTFTASLLGDRAVFNGTTSLASQAGKYTLALVHQVESADKPGGDGVGTITISTAGALALKGTLADGSKLAQKAVISKTGDWPFYANLYGGKGSTIGWLLFTNRGNSAIEGNVSWIKKNTALGKNYLAGFSNGVIGAGSAYPSVVPAGRIIAVTNGEVILNASVFTPSYTNGITLNSNNTVTVTSGSNSLKLTLTAASGAVKGTFINPSNGVSTKITGIILPNTNVVRGYFLTPGVSGGVLLQGQ